MVGDHPEHDLITARKLGMKTVFAKQGAWSKKSNYKPDYSIDNIKELSNVVKDIEKTA